MRPWGRKRGIAHLMLILWHCVTMFLGPRPKGPQAERNQSWKLRSANQSRRLRKLSRLLETWICTGWPGHPVISKGRGLLNGWWKETPGGIGKNRAFEREAQIAEIKQTVLLRAVKRKQLLLQFLSSAETLCKLEKGIEEASSWEFLNITKSDNREIWGRGIWLREELH